MLRVGGAPIPGFAELSGFFRTRDGWVRTHANYPHHRARLLAALALPDDADREAFERNLAARSSEEIETRAAEAGAIAVRVRDETEWRESAPGRAAHDAPLIDVRRRQEAAVVPEGRDVPTADRPLAGVRVLDLTRVIAGPVATRTLALLGAEVLRLDPAHLPEIAAQHYDTGHGKRTALLDLRDPAGLVTFEQLLDEADVLVCGYRPGSLPERLGLAASARRPGLIRAQVSAWPLHGPWAHRRGFDSIVQATSGIALIEGDEHRPGALPAQVLDHASGYLLAAAVVDAFTTRLRRGPGCDVAVSLAGTASWLLASPHRQDDPPPAELPSPGTTTTTHGRVTTARPALSGYPDYPAPAREWGTDEARWA
jgi:crotonobetainyl-CoA:carnitine CoA-transferase CaiB-like acyl-CoA transferase